MSDLVLLAIFLVWIPLIPLRLVIQAGVKTWRRIGDWYSLVFLIYWALIDMAILTRRETLLASYRLEAPAAVTFVGVLLILLAGGLAWWTSTTLGFTTLFLRPQLAPAKAKATLMISGPYALCRHPFYFMEWILLTGLLVVTGSWIVLILLVAAILIDPVVTYFEEKELVERFGEDYQNYQQKVSRLLPLL